MVRHKNRWLLVMVELADEVRNRKQQSSSPSDSFPSRKEFTARLRRTVSWCFGIAGEGAACEMQIRFFDTETRLVVVRVPREHYRIIWSALTLLLTRKQLLSLGEKTDAGDYQASVVSVHGSARTAKVATYRKLRELYRQKVEESRTVIPSDDKLPKKLCRALQERLILVQNNLN